MSGIVIEWTPWATTPGKDGGIPAQLEEYIKVGQSGLFIGLANDCPKIAKVTARLKVFIIVNTSE